MSRDSWGFSPVVRPMDTRSRVKPNAIICAKTDAGFPVRETHGQLLYESRFLGHANPSGKLEVKRVMKKATKDLSVGEMASRSGVAVSTLHYYESEGLIKSWRTDANHRRYDRSELRRLAIIRVAQNLGIQLAEIRRVLDRLPRNRPVSVADWEKAAQTWHTELDARIALLQRLRNQMGHCLGCGCLSIENCPLYNNDDRLGRNGAGPRRWLGTRTERED